MRFLRKRWVVMMVLFAFGTGTHSDQAVSVASKSFSNGLSGIWYQWIFLPVTPFYWLLAPVFRRSRAITTADFFEARYDKSVAILFAVVGAASMIVNMGVMLKGAGEVVSVSTGQMLSAEALIMIMTAMFVVYGIAGGLAAAIFTDFIQGILTVIFSFLLLPLVLNPIGGFAGMRQSIQDPEMLSMMAPSEIGIFFVVVVALASLIGVPTRPEMMAVMSTGKTELNCRVGIMGGNFLKRLCTIPWALTGLAAFVYFAGRNIEPDKVFGLVAAEFLPTLMPGMLGIFIAALLASVMSTCDAIMISTSALFTENVYKPIFKNKSWKHYLLVGRIASLAVVFFV